MFYHFYFIFETIYLVILIFLLIFIFKIFFYFIKIPNYISKKFCYEKISQLLFRKIIKKFKRTIKLHVKSQLTVKNLVKHF